MRPLGTKVRRLSGLPHWLVDTALGAVIFGIGAEQLVQLQAFYPRAQRGPALWLLAVAAAGLGFRRVHFPVAIGLVAIPLLLGLIWQPAVYPDTSGAFLAGLVMLYTISRRAPFAFSILALIVELVALFLARRNDGVTWTWLIQAEDSWIPLAWFAGRAQARRDANAARLEATTEDLRAERERVAQRAVVMERSRIAVELHTLVVEDVERMRRLARRTRRLLARGSSSSSEIAEIEQTGRRTLVEMRRALTLMRHVPPDDGRAEESTDASQPREASSFASVVGKSPEFSEGPPTEARRFRRLLGHPRAGDALVVAISAALAVGELYMVPWNSPLWPFLPAAGLLVGALWFRRAAPVSVLLLVATVILLYNVIGKGDPYTADRAFVVAVFTVAALRGPRWAVAAMAIEVLIYAPLAGTPAACDLTCQLPWFMQTVFAVVAGLAIRESTRLSFDLEAQAALLRRTREERVRLAVVEERLRLAREVHDLVAHGVTLMVIKAGAARWIAPSDPVQADGTLRSIEDEGRTALGELQSLLGALGDSPLHAGRSIPLASQRSLRAVVEAARNDGLDVELSTSGEERDVTGGLQLSLVRIMQEALTNVTKHAPGARVSIEIHLLPEGIELHVVNGPATSRLPFATFREPGHGLIGITERAALHTGWARFEPTADGGFHVAAFLAQERVLA